MRLPFGALSIETRRAASLSEQEREHIWAFARRFTDSTREGFDRSFAAKRDAVLIRATDTGELVGLGGVGVLELAHAGERCVVIFPGDTLFDPKVRGKSVVQVLGLLYYLECRLKHPTRPVFMVYGTFSYKTYLMLPRNFRTFWPRRGEETPTAERRLLKEVAERYYDDVRLGPAGELIARASKQLREGVATVDDEALREPDIRYFHEQNPGYARGEVLLCLIPLHARNWASVGRNMLRRHRRSATP